jgi:hypothetical protein
LLDFLLGEDDLLAALLAFFASFGSIFAGRVEDFQSFDFDGLGFASFIGGAALFPLLVTAGGVAVNAFRGIVEDEAEADEEEEVEDDVTVDDADVLRTAAAGLCGFWFWYPTGPPC